MRDRRIGFDKRIDDDESRLLYHISGLFHAPRRSQPLAVFMVQRDGHKVEETHAVEVAGVRIVDVVGVVCV